MCTEPSRIHCMHGLEIVMVLTCTAAKPSHHERAAGQSLPSDLADPLEVKQTGQIDFLSRCRCLAMSATAGCCRPRRSVGRDRQDMHPPYTCGALGRKISGQTGAFGAVETNGMNSTGWAVRISMSKGTTGRAPKHHTRSWTETCCHSSLPAHNLLLSTPAP